MSMRYSQGEGVNTSLSRITYCTLVLVYRPGVCLLISCVPFRCAYGYLPWHGHVLPRTLIIKIMFVNQHTCRDKLPAPISDPLTHNLVWDYLNSLIGDDVHPYRINYCDGPMSSRARQLDRDIAEVPLASDRNVANMASFMMTVPLIRSGPYSDKRAHQTRLAWAKSTSVAQPSGTESVKSESVLGTVSRRM